MNNITIELCAEDRARLDRLAEALERYPHKCENCVASVTAAMTKATAQAKEETAQAKEETAQEPKNEPQEAVEQEAPATTPTEKEQPAVAEETAPAEPVKPAVTVKMSDIQQKVVALSAAGKKAEVKAIVTAYAERVTTIPEDKWGEVFEQLTALEG